MAKRDIILAEIRKGGATNETLMAAADVNAKGLASQLTYLRLMGQDVTGPTCPKKQEDGTYTLVSKDEWAVNKSARGTSADASLSPFERVEKAEKKVTRLAGTFDRAKAAAAADPENELKLLKMQKAKMEMDIASIEQGNLEAQFKAEGVDYLTKPVKEEIEVEGDELEGDELEGDEVETDDDGFDEELEDLV